MDAIRCHSVLCRFNADMNSITMEVRKYAMTHTHTDAHTHTHTHMFTHT